MTAIGRTAALHIAFWQYDPLYRRAWLVWPQAIAILLASWLLVGLPEAAVPVGNWAKPADCTNASTPGCAATRRAVYIWDDDEVGKPTIANQITVNVDRSTFRNSAADDQPKLAAALGAYYRYDWAKAIDILKSATASDPNVQFVTALALLIPNSTDQARNAQALLREAAAGGHRQAGSVLGRILFVGAGGLPKDETAGRKLIDDAVAAGEPYAMRLAAAGYVSGEFGGTYDTVKAVDLLRRSADGGELIAMAQLAYCIDTGRGGLSRDAAKTIDYLRRAADAGFEGAQLTLARWFRDRYFNRESEDLSEVDQVVRAVLSPRALDLRCQRSSLMSTDTRARRRGSTPSARLNYSSFARLTEMPIAIIGLRVPTTRVPEQRETTPRPTLTTRLRKSSGGKMQPPSCRNSTISSNLPSRPAQPSLPRPFRRASNRYHA